MALNAFSVWVCLWLRCCLETFHSHTVLGLVTFGYIDKLVNLVKREQAANLYILESPLSHKETTKERKKEGTKEGKEKRTCTRESRYDPAVSFLFVGVFGAERVSLSGLWVQRVRRVCGAGRACCGGSWHKRAAQGAVGVPMLAPCGVFTVFTVKSLRWI